MGNIRGRLRAVDSERLRSAGKKIAGMAVAGLFLGGAAQVSLSDTGGSSGADLVSHIDDQLSDSPDADEIRSPSDEDGLNETTPNGTIDYHRLSC